MNLLLQFGVLIIGVATFIIWHLINFWKARAKYLEAKLSEGKINEIVERAKDEAQSKTLSDISNDFARRYSGDGSKRSSGDNS